MWFVLAALALVNGVFCSPAFRMVGMYNISSVYSGKSATAWLTPASPGEAFALFGSVENVFYKLEGTAARPLMTAVERSTMDPDLCLFQTDVVLGAGVVAVSCESLFSIGNHSLPVLFFDTTTLELLSQHMVRAFPNVEEPQPTIELGYLAAKGQFVYDNTAVTDVALVNPATGHVDCVLNRASGWFPTWSSAMATHPERALVFVGGPTALESNRTQVFRVAALSCSGVVWSRELQSLSNLYLPTSFVSADGFVVLSTGVGDAANQIVKFNFDGAIQWRVPSPFYPYSLVQATPDGAILFGTCAVHSQALCWVDTPSGTSRTVAVPASWRNPQLALLHNASDAARWLLLVASVPPSNQLGVALVDANTMEVFDATVLNFPWSGLIQMTNDAAYLGEGVYIWMTTNGHEVILLGPTE